MEENLLALIATTILAGCNLAPFDQKDYKWVDEDSKRPQSIDIIYQMLE